MNASTRPEDFWRDRSLVEIYASQSGALSYEIDAIDTAVRRAVATGPVLRVHVIGVGTGRELPAIRAAAPSAFIHAWDISQPMVDACRSFVEETGMTDVSVAQGDAALLERPDPSAAADLVIGLGAVLGYSTTPPQQRAALGSFAKLLRPGGSLSLVVQQRYGRADWAAWFAWNALVSRFGTGRSPGDRWSHHGSSKVLFHHYTRSELRNRLSASQFAEIEIVSLRQWGRAAHRSVRRSSPNPLIVTATYRPTGR